MPDLHHPADRWGIGEGYHDVWGNWREPSPEVAADLRRAMGATSDDPDEAPPVDVALEVVRPGSAPTTPRPGQVVVTEGGTEQAAGSGDLDLPLGLAEVRDPDGSLAAHLLVAPHRAHVPEGLRAWGVTAQLYAARSAASWGVGDLGDLRQLVAWGRRRGIGTVGLNPLHASSPGGPPATSPYSPSTRRWVDPMYLDVVAAARHLGRDVGADALAAAAALAASARIDRAAAWDLKRTELEVLWAAVGPTAEFERYRRDHGDALARWGTFSALAERHGPSWPAWPAELRHPDAPAVARAATELADQVAFASWLQWLADVQLAEAGAGEVAVTDLAVGFAPDGFDAWEWQDLLAPGCRIGAPPDLLGPDGQDWGLPPFVPAKLRAVGYRPLLETLRANLRHTRGLRIDHVMGLLRLYWIPPGRTAVDGAYVRWAGTELLDVVSLESVRAGSLVVGEDLGTVDDAIRAELGARGLLSTRLLWFEDAPPEHWPAQAMAAITTHDLPTVAGAWTGTDLDDLRTAGVTLPDDGDGLFRHRLRVAASVDDSAPTDDVLVAAHRRLADAPSMLVTAALDDLVGARHRPNVPGTIDEHPNWRIPLPVPLDDLDGHPLAERVVDALRATGR
ncbi:MAG: 4-alpha-glucanotransferase [Acidimicrobiales bacterium]|nr:4-alpha-glucanotransferase [Acidimicrobiales bacterium]